MTVGTEVFGRALVALVDGERLGSQDKEGFRVFSFFPLISLGLLLVEG